MIANLPGQRTSPGPHLRDYGCKVHVLMAMVQDIQQKLMTPEQIRGLTVKAIDLGYILDNNLPTDGSQGDWFRVFVLKPMFFLALAGVKKLTEYKRTDGTNLAEPYDYCEVEWRTSQGSHFGLGQFDNQGRFEPIYNPWPQVKTFGIKTLRFWRKTP